MDIGSSASSLAASHFARPAAQAPKPAAADDQAPGQTGSSQASASAPASASASASAPTAPGTGGKLDISV